MITFDEYAENIIDCHIHVGWYGDVYFSTDKIKNMIENLKISKAIVSSFSYEEKGMKYLIEETLEMGQDKKKRFLPIIWINPFSNWKLFLKDCYLEKKIFGIKIHPYADNYDVSHPLLKTVIEFASWKKIPIFAHTGNKGCYPSDFKSIIERFKDVYFILYHGRPLEDALNIASNFDNVFIETAFMEHETYKTACLKIGFDKIVFGSDLPLDYVWYPQENIIKRYKSRVETFINTFKEKDIIKVFNKNISNILNL